MKPAPASPSARRAHRAWSWTRRPPAPDRPGHGPSPNRAARAGPEARSAAVAVARPIGGPAGEVLATGPSLSDAVTPVWLISDLEWVCTLPAANNASDVLMTKTPFMTPPRPLFPLDEPSSVPAAEGGETTRKSGSNARLRGVAVADGPAGGCHFCRAASNRLRSAWVFRDGPGATGSRAAWPRSHRAWRASSASKEPC